MSCCMSKPTKWHVRPVKSQIRLGTHPVWSESLLSAWRSIRSFAIHKAHSGDSDQTGWMPRLIWVFAGHTGHFTGFVMLPLNYDKLVWRKSLAQWLEVTAEGLCPLGSSEKAEWLSRSASSSPPSCEAQLQMSEIILQSSKTQQNVTSCKPTSSLETVKLM